MVLIYLLTILLSFTGLGCGVALAYIAKEELKTGIKLFKILQVILLLSIMVFLFSNPFTRLYFITSLIFLFGLPSGSLIMQERFRKKKISKRTYLIYSVIYIIFIIILSILQLLQ